MLKCLECGHLFEEHERSKWTEPHGEEMNGCPICEGAYEETFTCKICGGEFLKKELTNDVCEECISDTYEDIPVLYKVGEYAKEEIEINGFLLSVFGTEEIEEILLNILKSCEKIGFKMDFSKFIKDDELWFKDTVSEVIKNEK